MEKQQLQKNKLAVQEKFMEMINANNITFRDENAETQIDIIVIIL